MSDTASNLAIRVERLSKRFEIYPTPADMLWELVTRKRRHSEYWALRDVSFEVNAGEVVGIMGRNGAGKSTLLKILTGTLEKTSGELHINGRVSSILELGTGFHPEYTGRENVYTGGMCLGMSRDEIDSKIDQIIEFSELRSVIDQSFKTYSTGMQARLMFSTAVSVDPEVLIVDEALSVGDARFQKKCFDKFREFRSSGKTILLVSHNQDAITSVCSRAILLEQGEIIADSNPGFVTKCYHQVLYGTQSSVGDSTPTDIPAIAESRHTDPTAQINPDSDNSSLVYGDRKVEILDVSVRDQAGGLVTTLFSDEPCEFVLRAVCNEDTSDLEVGFLVRDSRGLSMYGTDTLLQGVGLPRYKRGAIFEARLRVVMSLAAGSYFLSAGVTRANGIKYDMRLDAVLFQVIGDGKTYTDSKVNLNGRFSIKELEPAANQTADLGC